MAFDAQKVAQMIIEEAQAAGYSFRPGHHRSTAGTALSRVIEQAANAFIETHMRKNEKSAPTPPKRDEG